MVKNIGILCQNSKNFIVLNLIIITDFRVLYKQLRKYPQKVIPYNLQFSRVHKTYAY